MQRIQFYPSVELANILYSEATKKGVSVSSYLTDVLNEYYGLVKKNSPTVTSLTITVLKEVEDYIIKKANLVEFDLYSASQTFRKIDMTCGKKPSAVRASIGRSFGAKIGKVPFNNIRQCIVDGKNKLSVNNALMYEIF